MLARRAPRLRGAAAPTWRRPPGRRARDRPAYYVAFDVFETAGEEHRESPLIERRRMLDEHSRADDERGTTSGPDLTTLTSKRDAHGNLANATTRRSAGHPRTPVDIRADLAQPRNAIGLDR